MKYLALVFKYVQLICDISLHLSICIPPIICFSTYIDKEQLEHVKYPRL